MARWSKKSIRIGIVAAIAVVTFVIAIIPALVAGPPLPAVHDEFAYLLQADTFARGRLTNPPHPHWEFFETFHVIQQPTYASKFPPGQGLFLALGQLIGSPIIGAAISIALGCAAIAWMFSVVLPWRGVVIGAVMLIAHPEILWWAQMYWGGGVALLGGGLLGGAVLRILRADPRRSWCLIAACGIAILANSRPFEGLIITLLLGGLLLATYFRRRQLGELLARSVPMLALVLLPTLAWMGYYNWRVTGNAVEMPYMLHARQYMIAPLTFFQKPNPPPIYRHEVIREFHEKNEYALFQQYQTWPGCFRESASNMWSLWKAFFPGWEFPLLPLIVAASMVVGSRAARWSFLVCAGFLLLHLVLTPWMRKHYLAPALGFFFLLIALGMWRLERMRIGGIGVGRIVVVVLVALQLFQGGTLIANTIRAREDRGIAPARSLQDAMRSASRAREQAIEFVRQTKGEHLIFVKYGPAHPPEVELVYNGADIDRQEVIFARDMGSTKDQELIQYYPARHAWLLNDPDSAQPSLTEIAR